VYVHSLFASLSGTVLSWRHRIGYAPLCFITIRDAPRWRNEIALRRREDTGTNYDAVNATICRMLSACVWDGSGIILGQSWALNGGRGFKRRCLLCRWSGVFAWKFMKFGWLKWCKLKSCKPTGPIKLGTLGGLPGSPYECARQHPGVDVLFYFLPGIQIPEQ